MIYIEMNRSGIATGSPWDFTRCVWSPSRKKDGSSWAFWSKILEVKAGDTIFHLHGEKPDTAFIGYSTAATDGYETSERPPNPKEWAFANSFHRAELKDFVPLEDPVNLEALFAARRAELEDYFEWNKLRGPEKTNIFYVRQSGRLQCQNGAYFSEADSGLLQALFGADGNAISSNAGKIVMSVKTGTQIINTTRRIGQKAFSDSIKGLYSNRCCFPGCHISDPRFLIGSHIARWSDNQELRGHLGNGICLCVMHDRAFELGLFTLDDELKIFINPSEDANSSIIKVLSSSHGQKINSSKVQLLAEALAEHRKRSKIGI